MSRPNTRNKNKKQKLDDNGISSSDILRKIHFTGQIAKEDIRQLYSVSKPICQGCRINSKDSPNCFCGLIPLSNGTRKTGLWQRMKEIVCSLGPNPCKDLRPSMHTPAGLTNLGATCYANSILQCLYMNTSFRICIFSLELELLKQHPVLDQLARLFAQLHSSKIAFIDSAPFIKTLELDNGVQQDSHEFLTLFLSLLQQSLSHSKMSIAKTAIRDLFRGSVSHVTRCSLCGKDSEASSKMEDFYELELNIKGLNDLDESLDDYLSVEELNGENQYFCYSCGKRVDATRSIKLHTLPDVLNFQLKRYVFLSKTTTKKKITSAFRFPKWLNIGKRLSSPSNSDLIYELSAILVHKGTAVNSGHYVAHIKDDNSGNWWEFDDEYVSELGIHPFGEGSSISTAKSQPKAQNVNLACGNQKSSDCDSNVQEIFSSTDAYMLMYSLKKLKKDEDFSKDVNLKNSLPVYFNEEILNLNTKYDNACEDYQHKKDKQVSCITERREEVKSVLSEAPADPAEDTYFWISAEWLRLWADSVTCSSIDNSTIQCIHGKVPISKLMSMKRVSSTAWLMLHSKYGGGPTLSSDDFCMDCIKAEARSAVCAGDYRDREASLRQLAEAALAKHCLDGPSYYVSRAWLVNWMRKKNAEFPSGTDSGPTSSLQCSHGNLLPDQASGAKRVLVPETLWLFFVEAANLVGSDDAMGLLTFPSDSQPCDICSQKFAQVACLEDSLRATKLKQQQNHKKLISGRSSTLSPDCKYFLVPSSWLAKWKAYISITGKNISSAAEPPILEETIASLVCKHLKLVERPLDLVFKRGAINQKTSSMDGLILIPQTDWMLFCEEWNVQHMKGIQAEVTLPNSDSDTRKAVIRTHPEICEDCIGERETCELVHKLNYQDENICVYLVRGKEAPKCIIEASISESDRRTIKRLRKTSCENSVILKVSGSSSIYQLKMMLWEAFGIVKENQKLHKGSVEMEDDSATLADKNIFPGDILWVRDSEIYEHRDIADELSESNIGPRQTEEGFRGTLLIPDISIPQDI